MASPRELAKQRRGVIPKRVRVVARPCCVGALNARTRVREQVRVRRAGGACVGALEWSGPHPRGCSALERGGLCSRGGLSPRARRTPPEGAWKPRAGRTPPEGASIPRARRTSLEGRPLRGTSVPRGPPGSWLCRVCVLGVRADLCFAFFLHVLSRFPLGHLGDP
jgi:hypothetical protein